MEGPSMKSIIPVPTPEKSRVEDFNFETEDISQKIPQEVRDLLKEKTIPTEKMEMFENFLDSITEGKYSDQRYANHVMGAYTEATSKNTKMLEDIDLNKFKSERYSDFYLAFGKTPWVQYTNKEIIFFSPENPKFATFLLVNLIENLGNSLPEEVAGFNIDIEKEKERIIALVENTKKIQQSLQNTGKQDEKGLHYELSLLKKEDRILLPYLMLKKLPIELQSIVPGEGNKEGIYFEEIARTIEMFKSEYTNGSLKWADIVHTVVNLNEEKVYRYKGNREK